MMIKKEMVFKRRKLFPLCNPSHMKYLVALIFISYALFFCSGHSKSGCTEDNVVRSSTSESAFWEYLGRTGLSFLALLIWMHAGLDAE